MFNQELEGLPTKQETKQEGFEMSNKLICAKCGNELYKAKSDIFIGVVLAILALCMAFVTLFMGWLIVSLFFTLLAIVFVIKGAKSLRYGKSNIYVCKGCKRRITL